MILELLMIIGAVSGVLIVGNAIFGRIFDKELERRMGDEGKKEWEFN